MQSKDACSDSNSSVIALLIESGLVAQYGHSPEGLQWARQAMREELLAKGWTLSPYTDEPHDFRYAAMHRIADWPALTKIMRSRKSAALRLDSRSVAALYNDMGKDEWDAMSKAEHAFATAAIDAHPTKPARKRT